MSEEGTTLMACVKCGFGVRPKHAVQEMCGECAGKEIERLREVRERAARLCQRIEAEGGHGYTVHGMTRNLLSELEGGK